MAQQTFIATGAALVTPVSPNNHITPSYNGRLEQYGRYNTFFLYKFLEDYQLQTYGYRQIFSAQPQIMSYGAARIVVRPLKSKFQEETATYNNVGFAENIVDTEISAEETDQGNITFYPVNKNGEPFTGDDAMNALFGSICVSGEALGSGPYDGTIVSWGYDYSTGARVFMVYLDVIFGDSDVTPIITGYPFEGSVPKSINNLFSWEIGKDAPSFLDYSQSSAFFRWRPAGSSSYTQIPCGPIQSVNIPAGTFQTDEIEWQVVVTTNTGAVAQTDWITLSTLDATPEKPTIISPAGEIVDGTAPVFFRWEHTISTGSAQSAADLQYSIDGSNWQTLGSVTGASNEYEAPANTIPAGRVLWRVRTYNSENVAGPWSDATPFINFSAPLAPVVSATQTPRPLISWSVNGQQAFEVSIGDWSVKKFGTDRELKLPFFLENGEYIVRVRVQNVYGLWSPWGTFPLQVANTPRGQITLSVGNGYEAYLTWQDLQGHDLYLIYRNGVLIAKTNTTMFTDRFSSGETTYKVIGIMSDSDNFTSSESVAVSITSDVTRIISVDGSEWLELPFTDQQLSPQNLTLGRNGTVRHLAGISYPFAEFGDSKEKIISLVVATAEREEIMLLRSLVGKIVCLKTNLGEMVIGPLLATQQTMNDFYSIFDISVSQIHTEEALEL